MTTTPTPPPEARRSGPLLDPSSTLSDVDWRPEASPVLPPSTPLPPPSPRASQAPAPRRWSPEAGSWVEGASQVPDPSFVDLDDPLPAAEPSSPSFAFPKSEDDDLPVSLAPRRPSWAPRVALAAVGLLVLVAGLVLLAG